VNRATMSDFAPVNVAYAQYRATAEGRYAEFCIATHKRHSLNLLARPGAVIGAQQEAGWRQAGCKG
jgi:hypothetical protein